MGSIFDQYSKYNQTKGGAHAKLSSPQIEVVVDEPPLDLEVDLPELSKRVSHIDHPEEVRNRIRQLMDQEAHLRNQREKYRMNYYQLKKDQAPQSDFAKNYAVIDNLTRQLAPIYIERKKIEQSGSIETRRPLTADEEMQILALKQKKDRLIDKKSKLASKIKTHLAKPKGAQLLPQWEADLERVKLDIYELDEEIKRIAE